MKIDGDNSMIEEPFWKISLL